MDRELERLRSEKNKIIGDINSQIENSTQTIEDHLTQVRDEYSRVVQLSGQAGYVLDQIDREFKTKTKLASSDIVFLFLCTALQCARQYLLTNDKFRLTAVQGDALVEGTIGRLGKWSLQPGKMFYSKASPMMQFQQETTFRTLDWQGQHIVSVH